MIMLTSFGRHFFRAIWLVKAIVLRSVYKYTDGVCWCALKRTGIIDNQIVGFCKNSELLTCRKFTLNYSTIFVDSFDVRASRGRSGALKLCKKAEPSARPTHFMMNKHSGTEDRRQIIEFGSGK